jgi:hypothetical protein
MFNNKKSGIEILKEKIEGANQNLIEAQKVMNEIYTVLNKLEEGIPIQ